VTSREYAPRKPVPDLCDDCDHVYHEDQPCPRVHCECEGLAPGQFEEDD
jgi:hypothetical protein